MAIVAGGAMVVVLVVNFVARMVLMVVVFAPFVFFGVVVVDYDAVDTFNFCWILCSLLLVFLLFLLLFKGKKSLYF